jgi:hypothetical protein
MGNSVTTQTQNFFNSEFFTEFFIPETSEVWLYGDRFEAINESTPRIYLGTSNYWDTSQLQFVALPTTDGHGGVETKNGYIYEGKASDLIGTTHEHLIHSGFYNFNA